MITGVKPQVTTKTGDMALGQREAESKAIREIVGLGKGFKQTVNILYWDTGPRILKDVTNL